MAGFYRSKHILLLKVAILLKLAEYQYPPDLLITYPLLELANELITAIEPNMGKLSEGSGLAKESAPMARLLETVLNAGGYLPLMQLKKVMGRDLIGRPFDEVLKHCLDTQQLYKLQSNGDGVVREIVANKDGLDLLRQKGKLK